MRKLLIISSNTIHVHNYIRLIESDFDEILLLSNALSPTCNHHTIVLDFSLRNPLKAFRTALRIKQITKEFSPDVMHVHQVNSFAFLSFLFTGNLRIPRVLTAWGSDVLLLPRRNYLMKAMVKFSLREADGLTADANFVADEIRALLKSPSKEVLIANFGIQIVIQAVPKQNIIYSNRLHKKLYRVDLIIEAFFKFIQHPENKSWKLVIAGTGEETQSLKNLANSLGIESHVNFIGWVDKIINASFYAKAKIFVSIPESDATSISLLEAMAGGCIPVLSDLPANRQWITHLQNGFIVCDLKADYLSEALKIDLAKALQQNHNLIDAHGTMEANRNKFMSLYNQLITK